MYIGTQTINDIERRLYIFDCAFEADEFGRWIAVI
jgi:hypothetical protein